MNSELAIFAARLREFIGFCGDETLAGLPPAELRQHFDTEFNALALVLFGLQYRNNLPYRKLCAARGVCPDDLTHWTQIPAVPTAAFKELELTSLAPTARTAIFHSSGTTEQKPSRHFHHVDSLATYEAALWSWFSQNCGMRNAECGVAILTPPPAQAPRSSLVHMFAVVGQKLGAPETAFLGRVAPDSVWELDFDATLRALKPLSDAGRPMLVLGTAFSFVHLLDFLAEKNVRFVLPPGSRVMETGGYKNRSRSLPKVELHALIMKFLGVSAESIICEYGMSELSSQAYEIRNSEFGIRNFQFPPWARVQIISPETSREVAAGKTGLIRVFDLANVYSVMAVQTEDLGVRRGEGFELIGRTVAAEPRGCSLMTR